MIMGRQLANEVADRAATASPVREKVVNEQMAAQELLIRKSSRSSLIKYTVFTLPRYQVSWHHETTAYCLEQVATHAILRLMVFEPPRHGKSELTSVRFPAYYLGKNPQDAVIGTSYAIDLARTFSRAARNTVKGEQHQALWPKKMTVTGDTHWQLAGKEDERHSYIAAGVGGPITGEGANLLLIDDPVKNAEEALSFVIRESCWNWYATTARTRLAKNGAVVLIMTRWHEDDLAGRILIRAKEEKDADQWIVLELPATNEHGDEARLWSTSGEWPAGFNPPHCTPVEIEGKVEYRFKPYTALWPTNFDEQTLNATAKTIGTRQFTALYGQKPKIAEGDVIKRGWFHRWWVPHNYVELTGRPIPTDGTGLLPGYAFSECLVLPEDLDEYFDKQIQSWDLTFKDKKDNDFVAGHVYGLHAVDKYLLDRVNERMDFPRTKKEIKALTTKWPNTHAKYVEDKANGPAIIADLRNDVAGLIPVEPTGSKEARLSAASPDAEAGNVVLPHPSIAPWVYDFIDQLCSFPTGLHDDDCDAFSQGVNKLKGAVLGLVGAMKERQAQADKQKAATGGSRPTIVKVEHATDVAKPELPANADACPSCGSTIIQRVAGEKRCGKCGHQFGAVGRSLTGQTRHDALLKGARW